MISDGGATKTAKSTGSGIWAIDGYTRTPRISDPRGFTANTRPVYWPLRTLRRMWKPHFCGSCEAPTIATDRGWNRFSKSFDIECIIDQMEREGQEKEHDSQWSTVHSPQQDPMETEQTGKGTIAETMPTDDRSSRNFLITAAPQHGNTGFPPGTLSRPASLPSDPKMHILRSNFLKGGG